MIWKLIRAKLKSGCREEFIRRQRIWNDVMSRERGFSSVGVATDPADPLSVTLVIAMDSREDLARFMQGSHDSTFEATRMSELYESLDIRVLDVIEPGPQEIHLDVAPPDSAPAQQLVLLGQLFRVSAALRTGLACGVFDAVEPGTTRARLRERFAGSRVDRLIDVLASLGLLRCEGDDVALAPLAARHLVRGAPAFIGDAILHDTRPSLWTRWGALDERLGLPSLHGGDDHAVFLRAMTSIAAASQASALLEAVDFAGASRLLDVGGGCGDYALAICERVAGIEAVVFDLPQSEPMARERWRSAPRDVAARLSFAGGDYRSELPRGFDLILLSNVLRGETRAQASELLRCCLDSALPRGRLVVQDLFPHDPAGRGPLSAALFGIHLPDAANASVDETATLIAGAGWVDVELRSLHRYVVANRAFLARAPG